MKRSTAATELTLQVDRQAVNSALETMMARVSGKGPVVDAMRYAVLRGGKRIRPVLSLRIARLLDSYSPAVMRAALSVELYHSASLIIDDLPCMDNDDYRRGQPSVHRKYGEATAILAAFGLVSLGANSLTEEVVPEDDQPLLAAFQRRLLGVLDCSCLIGGQAMDLRLGETDVDPALAAELKTAPLFELAARAGALTARIPDREAANLHRFGRQLGFAFQLVDDVLDGEGQERQVAVDTLNSASAALQTYGEAASPLRQILGFLLQTIEDNALRHDAA